ncbi:hypothetical protein ACSQ67_010172 [Phaseolus vulgaris]
MPLPSPRRSYSLTKTKEKLDGLEEDHLVGRGYEEGGVGSSHELPSYLQNSNESQQEAKALPNEKSNEALELSNNNGEELVKEREALTDDTTNSYMAGFEDVVAQTSGIYLGMDFSQLGLSMTVVDQQLVDE